MFSVRNLNLIVKRVTKNHNYSFSTYQKYRKYYGNLKFKSLVPSQFNSFNMETSNGFEVMFFGTSANMPTKTRSASCIGLNMKQNLWLFDCGEGSIKNIQASVMNTSTISKIFITHLHGDHILGLPSLLMSVYNMDKPKDLYHGIDIYGPKGIDEYLTTTFRLMNVSYMLKDIHIHEFSSLFNGSSYTVYEDSNVIVQGAFIEHTIECLGYVITEKQSNISSVANYIDKNNDELSNYLSSRYQNPIIQTNNHKPYQIALLGDTCNGSSISSLCTQPNILIHECTLLSNRILSNDNKQGHSNASMAGQLARSLNAQNLVLTHFSRKLNNMDSNEYNKIFDTALQEYKSKSIILAHDNLVLTHS